MPHDRKVIRLHPRRSPPPKVSLPVVLNERFCEMDYWRMEVVYGEAPGYLMALFCVDKHIHAVLQARTYVEARGRMAQFTREVWGEVHSGFPIKEVADGRPIR